MQSIQPIIKNQGEQKTFQVTVLTDPELVLRTKEGSLFACDVIHEDEEHELFMSHKCLVENRPFVLAGNRIWVNVETHHLSPVWFLLEAGFDRGEAH